MVKVNRVRRIIRKIDPWTVLKVTLVLKRFTLTMMMKNYRFKVRDVWIVGFLFVNLVKDVLFTT